MKKNNRKKQQGSGSRFSNILFLGIGILACMTYYRSMPIPDSKIESEIKAGHLCLADLPIERRTDDICFTAVQKNPVLNLPYVPEYKLSTDLIKEAAIASPEVIPNLPQSFTSSDEFSNLVKEHYEMLPYTNISTLYKCSDNSLLSFIKQHPDTALIGMKCDIEYNEDDTIVMCFKNEHVVSKRVRDKLVALIIDRTIILYSLDNENRLAQLENFILEDDTQSPKKPTYKVCPIPQNCNSVQIFLNGTISVQGSSQPITDCPLCREHEKEAC